MGLPSLKGVNVLGTVLGVFSTLVTLWRLWYRSHTRKLWWDDGWALAAMLFSWGPWIFSWVIFQPVENTHVSQHTRVVCTYILAVTFELAIWSGRLSILCTIIRIAADRAARRPLYAVAVLFVTFGLVLSAQKFWVCVPQPGWADVPGGFCNFGKQIAITEIVTDIIGDALLIAIPVRMLWRLRITHQLRIRLFCVFGMSMLTTAASLAQNYYQIHDGGIRDNIVSHVELQTAVTVCSLNVIVAAFYRISHKTDLEETNSPSRDIVTIGTRRANTQFARSAHNAVRVDTETWTTGGNYKTGTFNDTESDYEIGNKGVQIVVSDNHDGSSSENFKMHEIRRH